MVEINQRSERDWAIYRDRDYKGTLSWIGNEFVCTHTLERFENREAAIQFLLNR